MRRKMLITIVLIVAMLLQCALPLFAATTTSGTKITLNSKLYDAVKKSLQDQKLSVATYSDDTRTLTITDDNLKKITTLDLSNSDIDDLTGLSNFSSVTNLNLSGNKLSSNSNLAELNTMTLNNLNLSSNQLTNVSDITNFDSIAQTDIKNQQVTETTVLKVDVSENSNQAKTMEVNLPDILLKDTGEINPDWLESENVAEDSNNPENPSIKWETLTGNTVTFNVAKGSGDTYDVLEGKIKITVEINDSTSKLVNTKMELYYIIANTDETAVTFKDENLFNAVKEQLTAKQTVNKDLASYGDNGVSLYNTVYEDAKVLIMDTDTLINKVPSLDLSNKQIKDLSGLEQFVSLNSNINISNNEIDSIEKVFELENNKVNEEADLQTRYLNLVNQLKDYNKDYLKAKNNLATLQSQLSAAENATNKDESLIAGLKEQVNTATTTLTVYTQHVEKILDKLYSTYENEYLLTTILPASVSDLTKEEIENLTLDEARDYASQICDKVIDVEKNNALTSQEYEAISKVFGVKLTASDDTEDGSQSAVIANTDEVPIPATIFVAHKDKESNRSITDTEYYSDIEEDYYAGGRHFQYPSIEVIKTDGQIDVQKVIKQITDYGYDSYEIQRVYPTGQKVDEYGRDRGVWYLNVYYTKGTTTTATDPILIDNAEYANAMSNANSKDTPLSIFLKTYQEDTDLYNLTDYKRFIYNWRALDFHFMAFNYIDDLFDNSEIENMEYSTAYAKVKEDLTKLGYNTEITAFDIGGGTYYDIGGGGVGRKHAAGTNAGFGRSSTDKLSPKFAYVSQETIERYVKLPRLKELNVSNNHVETLQGLDALTGLETLNANKNSINDITNIDWTVFAETMKNVDLGSNLIVNASALENLNKVENINLSKNLLSGSFNLTLTGMENLKTADFSYNQISNISSYVNQYKLRAKAAGMKVEEYLLSDASPEINFKYQTIYSRLTVTEESGLVTVDLPELFNQAKTLDPTRTSFEVSGMTGTISQDAKTVKLNAPSAGDYDAKVVVDGVAGDNNTVAEGIAYGTVCEIRYTVIAGTPVNPDDPTNPDDPDNPTPVNPDDPENPDNPDNPDNPENPDNPDKPNPADVEYGYIVRDGYIYFTDPDTSVEDVQKNIFKNEGYKATVKNSKGALNNYISTGGVIAIDTEDGKEVTILEIVVLGDVNGDGEVDALDSGIVRQVRNDTRELVGVYEAAADVNGDGEIDRLDALTILRYRADKISSFADSFNATKN